MACKKWEHAKQGAIDAVSATQEKASKVVRVASDKASHINDVADKK